MDIVVLFNGLGNQMSQYALYLSKLKAGQRVVYLPISNAHNGFELDRLFGVSRPGRLWTSFVRGAYHFFGSTKLPLLGSRRGLARFLRIDRYDENLDYRYQPKIANAVDGIRFLVGGWHSERNFTAVTSELKSIFTFPEVRDAANLSALQKIRATTSVSLHVRRGDYNDNANQQAFGSVCPPDFYQRAVDMMRRRVPSFRLVVFSNDPAWARENIRAPDVLYVNWNHGAASWIDMYLMSQCNHHIICNSTFSWWGAWLNKSNEKIVICPDRFVADEVESEVYPPEWIRIHTQRAST